MSKEKTYHEPSDVSAGEGAVDVDGPDHVDVRMTPEAAEETGQRLIEAAADAAGQRKLNPDAD